VAAFQLQSTLTMLRFVAIANQRHDLFCLERTVLENVSSTNRLFGLGLRTRFVFIWHWLRPRLGYERNSAFLANKSICLGSRNKLGCRKSILTASLTICFVCIDSSQIYAKTKYCSTNSGAIAVDVSEPVSMIFLNKVKQVGVSTIIRYYDYDPPTLPNKALRRHERDFILSHGFNIAVVFQHWNNKFSSFSAARGKGDAKRSLVLAKENIQPKGSVIYFGVDGPWGSKSELANIHKYFRSVNAVLVPSSYKVGVYGSGRVCYDLLNHGLAQFCWLANAKSWPGYKVYLQKKEWHLAQGMPENCGGKNVDFDILNGTDTYFGQFK
jgi:Domain of unknown function (DUF1906)